MAKHYIRVDGIIVTHGFSDVFVTPTDVDICINEDGNRQFELLGEINPVLINTDGTHRFRYVELITEEVVKVVEDVTDEVVVDTSGVTLEDGTVAVSDVNVSTTATATGYKIVTHSEMVIRYATPNELVEELATIPAPEPEPTEIEKLQAQVDALQVQNDMLTECILEMSEVVYGG